MIHRSMTFNGVDLVEDLGLHYSSFDEKLPEPKTAYVDVVAGTDIDLTEANGIIAYGDGEHTLVFLSLEETEGDRIETMHRVLALTHGVSASYTLSWKGSSYLGRCVTSVRHLTPLADLFTFTIRHRPFRTETTTLREHTDSVTYDNKLQFLFDLPAPSTYEAVRVHVSHEADATWYGSSAHYSTGGTYTLRDTRTNITFPYPVTVKYPDWWFIVHSDTPESARLNTDHATIDGDDLTLDSTWTYAASNYASPEVEGWVIYDRRVF